MQGVDCFVMWKVTYSETTWIAGTFHTAEWNLYETEEPWTNNH